MFMYLDCGEVYRRDELLSRTSNGGARDRRLVLHGLWVAAWVVLLACSAIKVLREIEMGQASTTVRLSNAVSCGKGNSGKSDGGRKEVESRCSRSSRSSSGSSSSLGVMG
jgi:hypothetical protein